jgi:hypothetical protein
MELTKANLEASGFKNELDKWYFIPVTNGDSRIEKLP